MTFPLKVNEIKFETMPFCHELVHIITEKVFGQQHHICIPIAFKVRMFLSRLIVVIIKASLVLQTSSADFQRLNVHFHIIKVIKCQVINCNLNSPLA